MNEWNIIGREAAYQWSLMSTLMVKWLVQFIEGMSGVLDLEVTII